jgi:ubiquinone/menaquinone biosynthesis C-methylase UbiE
MDPTRIHFDSVAKRYWEDCYATIASNHHALLLQRRREAVINLLGGTGGMTLELGCGPGVFISDLAEAAPYVVADLSSAMVQLAMERGRDNVLGGVQLSVDKLPFSARTFDLVIATGVLEYLPEIRPSLAEIHRILRPGGIAVISFPSRQPWGNMLRQLGKPLDPLVRAALGRTLGPEDKAAGKLCHRRYRPHTIKRSFSSAGFTVERCVRLHYFYFPFDALFFQASKKVDYVLHRLALTVPFLRLLGQTHIWRVSKLHSN